MVDTVKDSRTEVSSVGLLIKNFRCNIYTFNSLNTFSKVYDQVVIVVKSGFITVFKRLSEYTKFDHETVLI